jgi:predicted nucleic acid-binding Zn ribbon protein
MKFRFREKRENRTVSFGGLMHSLLAEFHLEESYLIERIRAGWPDVVGDIIATHSLPAKIANNTLFLSVDHPVYSNELSLMRDAVAQKINTMLGAPIVKNIKVEIKRIDWHARNGRT